MREDIENLISSEEADAVNPRLTTIYFRLIIAPPEWWENGEPIMRVRGGVRDGVSTTAWAELVTLIGVPPEEARVTLQWMHEKKIIDYRPQQGEREIRIFFAGIYFV